MPRASLAQRARLLDLRPQPSRHCRNSQDGDAGSTRPPHAKQIPRFAQPIGAEVGSQQSELDQVVLRAAAANAFVLPGKGAKRLDRRGKIPAFVRRKSARQVGR
jgi:hypothetical protein